MIDSVKTRLTLWHVGSLMLILIAFGGGIYLMLSKALYDSLDDELRSAMETTATILIHEMEEHDTEAEKTNDFAERTTLQDHLISLRPAVAIFDDEGKIIYQKPASGRHRAKLPIFKVVPDASGNLFTLSGEGSTDFRITAQSVVYEKTGAKRIIAVGEPLAIVADQLSTLRRILLIAIPFALLSAALLGRLLLSKSLSPMLAMSESARRIKADNLSERFAIENSKDEFGHLATTFNELLSRLQEAFNQQRRFMEDASHELRTPLSIIGTTAEVTMNGKNRDEQEYCEALSIIGEQSRRLTRIVGDMFLLARGDAGHVSVRFQDLYLDEILAEAACEAHILGMKKGVSVDATMGEESPYRGDETLLKQMLLNLLDNAIKHTPSGGRVRVGCSREDSGYAICVSDTGEGIPAESQPFIFDRFYRVDKARSRNAYGNGGGAGLGLSIVRWIAEAHQGNVRLVRSDSTGSEFKAFLPYKTADNAPKAHIYKIS